MHVFIYSIHLKSYGFYLIHSKLSKSKLRTKN